jgi:plastocyanin
MTRRYRSARWALAAILTAAALGLTACAGNSAAAPQAQASTNDRTTTGAMPGMSGAPATGGAADSPTDSPVGTAPVATNSVSIKNFAFAPGTITVKVGTTVTWTNDDQDPHTVTAMNRSFSSQPMNTGDTYRYTFTKPGSYDYLCTIHPFMTATVVVTA